MMKIKILVAGRYNDQSLTAQDCAAGSVLETHDWYGEELVGQSLAEAIPGTGGKDKLKMPARRELNTTSPRKNKAAAVTLPPNPFVAPVQQPLVAEPPVSAPVGEPAEVSDVENSTQTAEGGEPEVPTQSTPPQPSPSDGEGNAQDPADDDGRAGSQEPGE